MQIASIVKDELEEMFDRIDENGDRSISFEEFSSLMREMDHAKSAAQLRASFNAIDTNRDGQVSFIEVSNWIVH